MTFKFIVGVRAGDIDSVSDRIKSILGSDYERHDSSFLGEYNKFSCPESLVVKYNFVESEGEWDEPDFEHFQILISAGETDRPEFFKSVVEKLGLEIEVIRCREWKSET